jgi:hypothetical protein
MKRLLVGMVAGAVLLIGGRASGAITVTAGTIELGPAAQDAVLKLGCADIQFGAIVFDYAGAANPMATIRTLLTASYDGGRWDVGQFRNLTAAATGLTLGCFDDTSSSHVTVMATYPGDFNLDGMVDKLDLNIWLANAFAGTTWQQGDVNHDGVVNGLDRDLLMASFGSPPLVLTSTSTSVPEPTTLIIWSLLGALAITVGRWRQRRAA